VWASELVWTQRLEEKSFASAWDRTSSYIDNAIQLADEKLSFTKKPGNTDVSMSSLLRLST